MPLQRSSPAHQLTRPLAHARPPAHPPPISSPVHPPLTRPPTSSRSPWPWPLPVRQVRSLREAAAELDSLAAALEREEREEEAAAAATDAAAPPKPTDTKSAAGDDATTTTASAASPSTPTAITGTGTGTGAGTSTALPTASAAAANGPAGDGGDSVAESRNDKLAAKKNALAAKRGALAAKKDEHGSAPPPAAASAAPAVSSVAAPASPAMAIPDVVTATVAAATPPAESRTDKLAAKKGALAAKRGALAAKKESHASETPSAPPDAAPAVKADTPAETATTPAALVPIVAAPAAPESRTDKLAAKKSALAAKRGVLASKKESYAATDALQTSEPAAAVSSSSGGGGSSGGVLGSYSMIETIGQGSYAVVRCAHNLAAASNGFPETVAIKTIDVAKVSQHAQLPEVEAEVALLRSLDHPYIATLYESVSDPLKQEMSLVMEYAAGARPQASSNAAPCSLLPAACCPLRPTNARGALYSSSGGELYALIEKGGAIAEEEAALILAEIIDVLGYLHAKSIVHNDVKPCVARQLQPARSHLAAACGASRRRPPHGAAPEHPTTFAMSGRCQLRVQRSGHISSQGECVLPRRGRLDSAHRLWLRGDGPPRRRSRQELVRHAQVCLARADQRHWLRVDCARYVGARRHAVHDALRLPALVGRRRRRPASADPECTLRVPLAVVGRDLGRRQGYGARAAHRRLSAATHREACG